MKTFLVWETEYPEEGSHEVEARSEEHAIQIVRDGFGAGEVSEYDACELTPEIAAQRNANTVAKEG